MHNARVDELILRTLVFQFDGRVVEVFGSPSGDVVRYHVALMAEPQIHPANRKGRSLVKIGSQTFGIDADELEQLRPLIEKITQAARAAQLQD
jgi:hypothetical protein